MLTTGKIRGMTLTVAATLATVAFFQTGHASADPLGFASLFNFGRSEAVFAPAMRQLPKETDDGLTSDIPARLMNVEYPIEAQARSSSIHQTPISTTFGGARSATGSALVARAHLVRRQGNRAQGRVA
jgi:hypothetical protein